jgi:hypothetical protein
VAADTLRILAFRLRPFAEFAERSILAKIATLWILTLPAAHRTAANTGSAGTQKTLAARH